MMEIKSIPIADIAVTDRIRPVDENQAAVLAASIKAVGLITPITVRLTPNAKIGKYTLIAGAHRLRACIINEATEIDAIIVKGDQTASKFMEVTENLIRNDLSVIDRATHVQVLRDLYEEENGTIKAGRRNNSANFAQLFRGEGGFSDYVADRLGISKRAFAYLNSIAKNLNPALRECLRKTPLADNQAALLKFSKMEQAEQQRIALTIEKTDANIKQAVKAVEGKLATEENDAQARYLSKIISLLAKLDADHLGQFDKYYQDFSSQSEAA